MNIWIVDTCSNTDTIGWVSYEEAKKDFMLYLIDCRGYTKEEIEEEADFCTNGNIYLKDYSLTQIWVNL